MFRYYKVVVEVDFEEVEDIELDIGSFLRDYERAASAYRAAIRKYRNEGIEDATVVLYGVTDTPYQVIPDYTVVKLWERGV